eukprot:5663136-Alexandrium_andersonii.AAC.1
MQVRGKPARSEHRGRCGGHALVREPGLRRASSDDERPREIARIQDRDGQPPEATAAEPLLPLLLGGPADCLASVDLLAAELVEGLRLLEGPTDVELQARGGVGVVQ